MQTSTPTEGVLRISASAGSGKTFTITQLYIKRALMRPDAFRGILAITFTKKAANELKEKIIKKLRSLSLAEEIQKEDIEFGFADVTEMREKARLTLDNILHQYDDFQVSTIDSFFQSLFSGLSFEAGLPFGLNVEMDENLVKEEILEEGLLNLPENLKKILLENLLEILSDKGKGWKSSRYLKTHLLDFLFENEVVQFHLRAEDKWFEDAAVLQAKNILQAYLKSQQAILCAAAGDILNFLQSIGFTPQHLNPDLDKTFLDEIAKIGTVASGKLLFSKPAKSHGKGEFNRKPKTRKFTDEQKSQLEILLKAYAETLNPEGSVGADYSLAEAVLKKLTASRLLNYFRKVLKDLNQKHERYLLKETKFVLENLIQESDVPYVFEKLGQQLHTLLIDEFQDTDLIQWKVLRPLAKAIVDKGGFFSVVGDVKQSIYAWRGAESWLFHKGLNEDMEPWIVQNKPLKQNYRSEENIIRFNNLFFKEVSSRFPDWVLSTNYVHENTEWRRVILNNYDELEQFIPEGKEKNKGFTEFRCRILPKPKKNQNGEESEEEGESDNPALGWLVDEIKRLQNHGIPAGDIAILARSNNEIDKIVNILDAEKKKEEKEFDFSYTAHFDNTAGSQLIIDFLATALQAIKAPNALEMNKMRFILKHLEAPEKWWQTDAGSDPAWFDDFINLSTNRMDEPGKLATILDFFSLSEMKNQWQFIVHFQNLVYEFQNKHSQKYPDFQTWWHQTGNESNIAGVENSLGIQIMTIHKSKGLDFGVVIFPVKCHSSQVSKWAAETFWLNSDQEPWNAYPLLYAKGKKGFLNSGPGQDFGELVYKNALEYLNLYYVAMTRPRYGLILDFSFYGNPFEEEKEPSPTNLGNIAFQSTRWLRNNKALLEESFQKLEWYPEDPVRNLDFGFRIGQIARGKEKSEESPALLETTPSWNAEANIPWTMGDRNNEEAMEGIYLHHFLETLEQGENWREKWTGFLKKSQLSAPQAENLSHQLDMLFQSERVKNWFSDRYVALSELEMLSENGLIIRADRLLKTEKEMIILDFKTGEQDGAYIQQVREYLKVARSVFSLPVQGYVVYTRGPELIEVL
jgi:ATP-dependent exoDNAse (exonuclease V) beta subunit